MRFSVKSQLVIFATIEHKSFVFILIWGGKSCSWWLEQDSELLQDGRKRSSLQTAKHRRGGNGEAELPPVHRNARKKADETERSDGISPRSTGTCGSAHSEQKTECAAGARRKGATKGMCYSAAAG